MAIARLYTMRGMISAIGDWGAGVLPESWTRRRRLTAELLPEATEGTQQRPEDTVIRGVLVDARSHLLVVATAAGEERLLLCEESRCWRGGPCAPTELRAGEQVVVRRSATSRWTAAGVWAELGRVSGVIVARDGEALHVDAGHARGVWPVRIPEHAAARIADRLPRLEPGFLFDAVGRWRDGALEALTPATRQPGHPAAQLTLRRRGSPPGPGGQRQVNGSVAGLVTWFDPILGRSALADPLAVTAGAAYPALDSAGDCGERCDRVRGCAPLPLLSIGMTLRLSPVAEQDPPPPVDVPIVCCGSQAGYFCDAEPDIPAGRGRIAELTLASFLAMGGSPLRGGLGARMAVPRGGRR